MLYVLLAVLGGALGIAGVPNLSFSGVSTLTIGTIVSFLTLSRSYINPIGQISMKGLFSQGFTTQNASAVSDKFRSLLNRLNTTDV